MIFMRIKICSVELLSFPNPGWSSLSQLSISLRIRLMTNIPKILFGTKNNVIPVELSHFVWPPFLEAFISSPFLHISGILMLSHSVLDSFLSCVTVVSRSASRISVVILSAPPKFPFFNHFNAVLISSSVMCPVSISLIDGVC